MRVVQLTMRSVLGVYDIRPPIDTCSKLPATFALFPVLSLGYAHAQLRSFYPLSTFNDFLGTKNTRLSMPAQLQCSGLWDPGNEARSLTIKPQIGFFRLSYKSKPQWRQQVIYKVLVISTRSLYTRIAVTRYTVRQNTGCSYFLWSGYFWIFLFAFRTFREQLHRDSRGQGQQLHARHVKP